MPKTVDRNIFLNAMRAEIGDVSTITRTQVLDICAKQKVDYPNWLVNDLKYRLGRGLYSLAPLSKTPAKENRVSVPAPAPAVRAVAVDAPAPSAVVDQAASAQIIPLNIQQSSLVPEKVNGYVPFGHFADVRTIVASKKFYPIYITGLSGNGKTMMVEQVCAAVKRECVRVNITIETDEDDLLGGFRLIDGKTVWQNGPVVVAMERGAVLLLDEVDLGSNKLMCLQPVLEGKPIYLKKINRVITPASGFNVIATANTKGKGSDDGRFIGTNVMNDAFLERFAITMEQEYPASKVEAKILQNVLSSDGIEDNDFVDKLVQWADVIRKSFYEGAIEEIISTRRLVQICGSFAMFGDRLKSVNLCLNRFDDETKRSFLELYSKCDETVASPTKEATNEEVAF